MTGLQVYKQDGWQAFIKYISTDLLDDRWDLAQWTVGQNTHQLIDGVISCYSVEHGCHIVYYVWIGPAKIPLSTVWFQRQGNEIPWFTVYWHWNFLIYLLNKCIHSMITFWIMVNAATVADRKLQNEYKIWGNSFNILISRAWFL